MIGRLIFISVWVSENLNGLDPVPFDFNYCKIKITTGNSFINGRKSTRYFKHEAREGIAFTLYGIKGINRETHGPAQVIQHDFCISDISVFVNLAYGIFFFIKFILD